MIVEYSLEQGRVRTAAADTGSILLVTDPTAEERDALISRYRIDEHNVTSAMDPNELPRVEVEDDHIFTIFKHPKSYSAHDDFVFRTNSIGLFLFRNRLIIIATADFGGIEGRAYMRVPSLRALFLRILSQCITHFVHHLQIINDIGGELESKLMTSMENRSLVQLFSVEKSLVYYVNAIGANGRAIARLKANARNVETQGLSPDEMEYVEDLGIENDQCLSQAQVYANVFTGLMDARATIVSNNLNVLMKRLTVITVVFLPINVIASIGGMSEYTEWTQGKMSLPIAYVLFSLGMVVTGVLTYMVLRHMERRSFR